MSKIMDGTDLMCYVNGTSVAFATNHTLSISADTADSTSHKDARAGWIERTVNTLSWEVTSENLYALDDNCEGNSFEDIFDLLANKSIITLRFGIPSNQVFDNDGNATVPTVPDGGWTGAKVNYYQGEAYISNLELNAPCGENATFTVTFSGTGAITKVTT